MSKALKSEFKYLVLCVLSRKDTKIIGDTAEETKEFHRRHIRAISNPIRRTILRVLKEGDYTLQILKSKTGLNEKNLEWHLSILEYGFCIEKEQRNGETFYKITKDGMVAVENHKEP